MFDLDKEIAKWRSELMNNHGVTEKVIDELESHVRDSVEELSSDMELEKAFHKSVQILGSSTALAAEFEKDRPVTKGDWAIVFSIIGFFFLSLFSSWFTFFQSHSAVAEVIKWYFVTDKLGTHVAHMAGGLSVYYIFRYMVCETEEIGINRLFAITVRLLLPLASLFIWTGMAIYALGNGPSFSLYSMRVVLLIAAPVALLPLIWMRGLSRVRLAQFITLFWGVILYASSLKDHRDEFVESMPLVLGLILLVVVLPWLQRVTRKITPA